MLLRDTARRKQGNGASGKDSRREHLPPLPLDYRRGSVETESLSQDDRSANSSDPDGELQSSDHHANEVDEGWRHTPEDHQHPDVLVHYHLRDPPENPGNQSGILVA